MVGELRREDPGDQAVISRVARQLGVGVESLRNWVKQADVAGARGGLSTPEHEELRTLGNDRLIWPHLGHLCRSEVAPPPTTTKPYVSGSEEPPNEGEGDEEGGALRSYPT